MDRRRRNIADWTALLNRGDRPARRYTLPSAATPLFVLLAAAAVLFWVEYALTLKPAAFFIAALLTFFAVMRLRRLTKPRD